MEFGDSSTYSFPETWDDVSLGSPSKFCKPFVGFFRRLFTPSVARPWPLGKSNVNILADQVGEDVVGCVPRRKGDILTWYSYTHATVLAPNIKIKTSWNPDLKTKCVYIARKGFERHPGIVKFTFLIGSQLHVWLKMVLMQIAAQGDRSELIPYFKGKEKFAMERINYADRMSFWCRADLNMQMLKVRLSYSSTYQDYSLHLINPVPAEVSERYNGWPGVVTTFHSAANMKKLCNYLETVVEIFK